MFKKFSAFFSRIREINNVKPALKIKGFLTNQGDNPRVLVNNTSCSFDIILPISHIVKNEPVLLCFDKKDINKMVYLSGICKYRITAYTPSKKSAVFTIESMYKGKRNVKNYTCDEILSNKHLFDSLSKLDQKLINQLSVDNKVITLRDRVSKI